VLLEGEFEAEYGRLEMAAKWHRRELELERHAANHPLERRDLAS